MTAYLEYVVYGVAILLSIISLIYHLVLLIRGEEEVQIQKEEQGSNEAPILVENNPVIIEGTAAVNESSQKIDEDDHVILN